MSAAQRKSGRRRAFPGSFRSPSWIGLGAIAPGIGRSGARSPATGGGQVTPRAGSPASTCGSCGAWHGPMGYATGSPAGVSWWSRWSVKRTRALMDVPSSSSEREQVVPVASGMPASAAPSSGMYRQVRVALAQRVGVGKRPGCSRRERLAHPWSAGNRRGVLSGGFPLQGNAAANYGGGEVARRVGVALGLVRPGDERESKRRWPPGDDHGPPHALTGPKVGGGGGADRGVGA